MLENEYISFDDDTTIPLQFYTKLITFLSSDNVKDFEDLIDYIDDITFLPYHKHYLYNKDSLNYDKKAVIRFLNGLKPYIMEYLKDSGYDVNKTLVGYYYGYINDCERDIEEYKSKLEETEKKMNTFKEKLDTLENY